MQEKMNEILAHIAEEEAFEVRYELYRSVENMTLLRMVAATTDSTQQEVCLADYGSYIFARSPMNGSELSSLLHDIDRQDGTPIHIDGVSDEVSCSWSPCSMQYEFQKLARGQWYGFQRRNYPAKFYQSYEELDKTHMHPQVQELNGPGLPYFRSLEEAETYYLFGSILEHSNSVRRVLQIVIDDKRAWIDRIFVGETGLHISIRGEHAEMCEVKLSAKRPGLVAVVSALEAMKNGIKLETLPAELNVYLSLDNEIVDQRFISEQASMYSPTEDVSYVRDEKVSIEGIIRLRGEGIHHDYKETFTHKIFAAVCAFANTEGGSVLIGIDDDGNIMGVDKPDETRLKIENFLEDHAVGKIDRRYVLHELRDAQGRDVLIMELHVHEAQIKPVAIRDKDKEKYYVRRDGSNRPMKREDIVHIINQAVEKNSVRSSSLLTNPQFWMK